MEYAAALERVSGWRTTDLARESPILLPQSAEVWELWEFFGRPAEMFGGLAMGLTDRRSELFIARDRWLEREGFYQELSREAVAFIWEALRDLDLAYIQIISARISKKK